jgi:phage regulator Rha-like protein
MPDQSKPLNAKQLAIPAELIERRIYVIRDQKVMIDSDLADLYQILTKNLNRAVSRNRDRFPGDFMFQLTAEEAGSLRFRIGASNEGRGGRRYLPYAFPEHGVAMLSSVLNGVRAVQMNIAIIRAFVRMRELLAGNKDLAARIEQDESMQERQESVIAILADEIETLKRLPPPVPRRRIGFTGTP